MSVSRFASVSAGPASEEHLGLEALLTPEDMRRFLRLDNVTQVYALTRKAAANRLPSVRIGKYLRFSPSAVRAWLAKGSRR
jgi:hypothetical protein